MNIRHIIFLGSFALVASAQFPTLYICVRFRHIDEFWDARRGCRDPCLNGRYLACLMLALTSWVSDTFWLNPTGYGIRSSSLRCVAAEVVCE